MAAASSSASSGPKELRRLDKELADIRRQVCRDGSEVRAETVNGDLRHWHGYIKGPKGTPYENGTFKLDIYIPPEYPFLAPKIRFLTNIWHPNVSSQTGAICLDILGSEWSPALTIRTALLSLQALLSSPEPTDPQDAEVAKMYLADYDLFCRTARTWTELYAQGANEESRVARLTDMGFDAALARRALEKAKWDEGQALNLLLDGDMNAEEGGSVNNHN